jgi:rsbT co-antagonist protein RsbR
MSADSTLRDLIGKNEKNILEAWLRFQVESTTNRGLIKEAELREQSRAFLSVFTQATGQNYGESLDGEAWNEVRSHLTSLSRNRAQQGFSPSETATFVFSLKQPLFDALRQAYAKEPERLADELWKLTVVLDRLGMATVEAYQKSREQVIMRQQQELLDLSTPVVQLWKGILALPLIGTLDSERTQVVMESLLEAIVKHEASIAVIDITGVSTVDTLVAQHLLKTVAAARLMGADCIISGIRPQIAQTIVHLGVELGNVATKASLSEALRTAFTRVGLTVVPVRA